MSRTVRGGTSGQSHRAWPTRPQGPCKAEIRTGQVTHPFLPRAGAGSPCQGLRCSGRYKPSLVKQLSTLHGSDRVLWNFVPSIKVPGLLVRIGQRLWRGKGQTLQQLPWPGILLSLRVDSVPVYSQWTFTLRDPWIAGGGGDGGQLFGCLW